MPFVAQTLDGAQMASRDDHALTILGDHRCNVHLTKINTRGHETTQQGWVGDPCINGQGKADQCSVARGEATGTTRPPPGAHLIADLLIVHG
jgi:hypothetical protein